MTEQRDRIRDEEILAIFNNSGERFLTAPEVAAELNITRQAVNTRLKQLETDGKLESKSAGSRAIGWWIAKN